MRAINLLPEEERGGQRGRSAQTALTPTHGLAAAGAVVLVVMAGTWAMARHDTSSAHQAEAEAVAQSASSQAQVDRLAPVVAFDARRADRETAVLQLAAGRNDWAMVLSAAAGALPDDVAFTKLSLAAADAASSGTTAAPSPAGLAGSGSVAVSICADTQPKVATTLRRLRALPQVEDVALSQSSRSAAGGSGGSGGSCSGVQAEATLGLSTAAVIDGAPAAAAGASGSATPGAPPASSSSTGTGR